MSASTSNAGACLARLAYATKGLDALIHKLGEVNGPRRTTQVFDSKAVYSARQLLAAYVNSKARFAKNTNRTRDIAHEMLLFMAQTNQINDAIKGAGAKDGSPIVLFADSKSTLPSMSEFIKLGKGIPETSAFDKQLLQKMALLQIED